MSLKLKVWNSSDFFENSQGCNILIVTFWLFQKNIAEIDDLVVNVLVSLIWLDVIMNLLLWTTVCLKEYVYKLFFAE